MLVNKKDIRTEGDLGGERIAMSLDQNSLVHLMSVLSDLYSDPAAAVIREYTTNAIDSHLAAGNPAPVELTAPTALSPYFVVQDFGVGLSVDEIREIYSKFGASTKRDSNLEAGMLGLGSKSALTFTEQFTVIATKNGETAAVSVSRSADGSGAMQIVAVTKTDKPNGVTIKIPVAKDQAEFTRKIYAFADFTRGAVKINGVRHTNSDLEFISDRFAIKRKTWRDGYTDDRIVMGGVSYPIDPNKFDELSRLYTVVYFAPMGSVDFTPSREELMYTETTKATLEAMREHFESDMSEHLASRIDNCNTIREAYNLQFKMRRDYGINLNCEYHGISLPSDGIQVDAVMQFTDGTISKDVKTVTQIPAKGTIVTGWRNKRFTKDQATKLFTYMKNHGIDTMAALMLDTIDLPELFDGWVFLEWDDAKAIKLNRTKRAGKPVKRWESYSKGLVEVDKTKPIYYASRSFLQTSSAYASDVVKAGGEMYYVTEKEQERFLKDYPNASHLREFYRDRVRAYVKGLTQADYDYFKYSVNFRQARYLHADRVLDPELVKMVKYNNRSSDHPIYDAFTRARSDWNNLTYEDRRSAEFKLPEFEESNTRNVERKYPLLFGISYHTLDQDDIKDHMTRYVNMIYRESQGRV